MHTSSTDKHHAGALLFVRSHQDLSDTIRWVNELLVQRNLLGVAVDDVLGVCLGECIDTSLVTGHERVHLPDTQVTLRESVGLSKIWSLCLFDLNLPDVSSAGARRQCILESLRVSQHADHVNLGWQHTLLPVLTMAEVGRGVEAIVNELSERFPALPISQNYFVYDLARGGLVHPS